MSALRIGMFTTFYPPFNFGGDGVDVQRTARALVRRGHQVTVVHDVDAWQWLAGRTLPDQPRNQDGVEVVGLRSRLGVLAPLLTHQLGRPVVHGAEMHRLVAERRFDVVLHHNASLVGGPGLLDVGGDAATVYVAHEHWLVCPTHVLWRYNAEPCDRRDCTRCVLAYRRPPQLWRYTGMLERRLPQVDLFIARSAFSRDMHARFGFERPMSVLPYFLPDDSAPASPGAPQPVGTTAQRAPHPRPYFLFVGRLARIKGVHTLIPQFARYPHADLLIVGDGEDEAMLRTTAAGVPNVHFAGRAPNDQLTGYYAHALAVLCPSVGYETFGIVLIEAMRARVPVIARRIGPFPEIVESSGGGLLYDDDDQLAACLARVQQDAELRAAMADRGYRASVERWSESVVIPQLLELIDIARAARERRGGTA